MPKQQSHLAHLDSLRAVAALAVCVFHLSWQKPGEFFGDLAVWGHHGVAVFFCISGFIIPFAMDRGGYKLADAPNFLLRRFLRLYPAFIGVLLITLLFTYFGFHLLGFGTAPHLVTFDRVVLNLLLIGDTHTGDWYLPVFWTLAIEAQFYLLIAITFSLFSSSNILLRSLGYAIWLIPPLYFGGIDVIFRLSGIFMMGIIAFLYYRKKVHLTEFVIVLLLSIYSHTQGRTQDAALIGAATSLIILFGSSVRIRPLEKIGESSYSLYLLHMIIGHGVIVHSRSFPMVWYVQLPMLIIACITSVWAAQLYFKYVELPTHNFAKRLRKRATQLPTSSAEIPPPSPTESSTLQPAQQH